MLTILSINLQLHQEVEMQISDIFLPNLMRKFVFYTFLDLNLEKKYLPANFRLRRNSRALKK